MKMEANVVRFGFVTWTTFFLEVQILTVFRY